MTAPSSTIARWEAMTDTERLEAYCAMEAERDLYRESTALLRESASLYLRALRADRRSLARLLSIVSPSSAPATGSIAEEGPLSTPTEPKE